MSDLRVTNLRGRTSGSSPSLPDGVVITGVTTSTSFDGALTGNVNTTGVVTAASFVGDGSGLVNVATNSVQGFTVNNNGSLVGIAKTIDFGANLDVSPASAGFVTVTGSTVTLADESSDDLCFPVFATGATGSQELKTHATLAFDASNGRVGIGTTDPSELLNVYSTGNATIQVTSGTSGQAAIQLGDTAFGSKGFILYENSIDTMILGSNSATRMRIGPTGIITAYNEVDSQNGGLTADGITVGRGNSREGTNTAIGVSALQSNSNSGIENTAVGYAALYKNTSGSENLAIGISALNRNTTGDYNTAVGPFALVNTLTADYNTAVGYAGLYNCNSSGIQNTAVGAFTLFENTS